jgi:simple sugar transport system permease protein
LSIRDRRFSVNSYRRIGIDLAVAVAAGLCVVVLLWILLVITGHDAGEALTALWEGSFGSRYAFASATLVRATPLILAGLAVALAFRAGVWNIGAEGQLLFGAAAASAVGLSLGEQFGGLAVFPAIVAGAAAGALLAGIAGILRARAGVLEIISTIMLNFVALHLVGYLIRGPLQEPTGLYPQSATLDPAVRLGVIIPGTRLHSGIIIAGLAAVALWTALRFTEAGFRVRAVGANPVAAKVAGSIDVGATTFAAFLLSGALAGIAGAVEVTGVTYALYESLSPGYGYTAIAVALLARLNPLAILLTGTLLGALQSGGAAMQRDAGVPSVLVSIVEAMLILAMVGAARSHGFSAWRRGVAETDTRIDGATTA